MQKPKFKHSIHWHDKAFTLSWDLPNVWAVLVYFKNGQSRHFWFKRTERPYRFKRWFLKKGKDQFRNIANINSPSVTLYLFRGFWIWPHKVILPMQVEALRVIEPETRVVGIEARNKNNSYRSTLPQLRIQEIEIAKPKIPSITLINQVLDYSAHPSLESDFTYFKNSQSL